MIAKLPCDEFVAGWCFAVAREELLRVGGFDGAMRVYWSDTDLQCRLVRDRGESTSGLVGNARLPVRHLAHRTARGLAQRRRIWREDRAAFVRKWSAT